MPPVLQCQRRLMQKYLGPGALMRHADFVGYFTQTSYQFRGDAQLVGEIQTVNARKDLPNGHGAKHAVSSLADTH